MHANANATTRPMPASASTSRPVPANEASAGLVRSVVIGRETFNRLKLVQNHYMPSTPRLDMRYLIDGALEILTQGSNAELRSSWGALALQAMLNDGQRKLSLAQAGADGAGRKQGGHPDDKLHLEDCKSLQISELSFQRLRTKQQETTDPRLGIRYLTEGAIEALVERRRDVLEPWAQQARLALQAHLASLQLPQTL